MPDRARRGRATRLLAASLLSLAAACGPPVDVDRVDPRVVTAELERSALTSRQPSTFSETVLYRWNLAARFEKDPEGALAELRNQVLADPSGRSSLFALAELCFRHADASGKREYYLASAVYAYAFLFPGRADQPLEKLDPRVRIAADLYNRGLTGAFASRDGHYETGNPIPYSSMRLRETLTKTLQHLDPEGKDPALRHMVVIGHSQGGLLTKMTAIDSGRRLWGTVSRKPIDQLRIGSQTRDVLQRSFLVKPLPFVRRVIFISTPHRGSYVAAWSISHFVSRFARLPVKMVTVSAELLKGNRDALVIDPEHAGFGAVYGMTPGSPFIKAPASIPLSPR